MAGCPFIFLGTDPLARGSKLAQGRRSQRVTIGRYDRSLVRDDPMSLMIPYDSQDFPSAYGIGPGNLTTSWDDLLWAGLTVGRPALETVYEPGRNTALFDHLRYWA